MALSFPYALPDFLDLLAVSEMTLSPAESVIQSQTRGGEILRADLGTRLWGGRIVVAPLSREDADRQAALVETLLEAQGSFLVARRSRIGPQSDPAGAILGGATPTIGSVSLDRRDLQITGLPAGYVLTRGDLLSFAYGSSPVRYALHRVVNGRTANGAGTIFGLPVSPLVRPGAAAGNPVTLVRPFCKAVIVPGTYQAERERNTLTEGFRFDWRQTLR